MNTITYELRLASRTESGEKTSVCDQTLSEYSTEAAALAALHSNDTAIAMHHIHGASCAEVWRLRDEVGRLIESRSIDE